MPTEYSYWRAKAPKCPHCGKDDRMEEPQSDLFEDEAIAQVNCQFCGKDFVVCVSVSVSWKYSSAVDEDAVSHDHWGPRETAAVNT